MKSKASRLRDWNLLPQFLSWCQSHRLEIKSISITRLKLKMSGGAKSAGSGTWNQKHLDYEIETLPWCPRDRLPRDAPWNQKHLDYEIETKRRIGTRQQRRCSTLKSKASRLRDWNGNTYYVEGACAVLEIKSISITRLKQVVGSAHRCSQGRLEIKSISITRLKHYFNPISICFSFVVNLKLKASRLRDWNGKFA